MFLSSLKASDYSQSSHFSTIFGFCLSSVAFMFIQNHFSDCRCCRVSDKTSFGLSQIINTTSTSVLSFISYCTLSSLLLFCLWSQCLQCYIFTFFAVLATCFAIVQCVCHSAEHRFLVDILPVSCWKKELLSSQMLSFVSTGVGWPLPRFREQQALQRPPLGTGTSELCTVKQNLLCR